ncbi:hypothetical protein TRIUR3_11663 [Triticum urartu]|uniref:Uncharacterized protein n=2 Tax=Triticum TaxID=4564 RepID=A0A9R0TV94_TRITD|nr:hypothetical protein TRIUR3_11663 [Triticum urartu]VAI20458.1 unnamed protein product [Triticum turgidum subsp. durum]
MAATTRGLMLNISCLLLFLGSLLPGALSTTFTLTNSCAYTPQVVRREHKHEHHAGAAPRQRHRLLPGP